MCTNDGQLYAIFAYSDAGLGGNDDACDTDRCGGFFLYIHPPAAAAAEIRRNRLPVRKRLSGRPLKREAVCAANTGNTPLYRKKKNKITTAVGYDHCNIA